MSSFKTDDYDSDNQFLTSTLEVLIDKMHEHLAENELLKAEIIAERIAQLQKQ
tara:strand:+ start:768 stop:926 length:159 start_codon:yes stop_codon:yes gene_type:complete